MNESPEEKARRFGVPLIPKKWPIAQQVFNPNPVVSVCGECDLEIRVVMGFYCGRSGCPTGLGGITCSVATLSTDASAGEA
jgi:hypothetical protein